jgi:transcriptional regulator with XRE-family HTH domain
MIGGKELTQIVDRILAERGISRVDFCKEIGISSAAYSGWKKGSQPREDKIIAIEKCLGISFSDYEKSDPRELLREDLATLLRSAEDLPPSSVYELIAEIHRRKEMGKVDSSS